MRRIHVECKIIKVKYKKKGENSQNTVIYETILI